MYPKSICNDLLKMDSCAYGKLGVIGTSPNLGLILVQNKITNEVRILNKSQVNVYIA